MAHPPHLTKILYHEDEAIDFFNIFSSTKDKLFRMKVKCDYCDNTQCRCFKTIEDAIHFEGFVCSNRCFVLACRGEDETLDKIIDDMKLEVPLESLDDAVFEEIISGMGDELFDEYECPAGDICEA